MATKKKVVKSKLKNFIAFCLDTSGSMSGISRNAQKAYNDMLGVLREESQKTGQQTYVSLVFFDSTANIEYAPTDVRIVNDLPNYPIRGMTALYDGVALGAETIENSGDENSSYLVIVYTDGFENASRKNNANDIRSLIKQKEATGKWTFTFQMPPGQGKAFAQNFGISQDNVREWEATAKGVNEASEATASGMTSYFSARSAGQTQVKNFYQPVTTDLSQLSANTLKKELDDISGKFKVYQVAKEQDIKSFVEEKTNAPLIIGSVYYLLTKTEKIQPNKSIAIMKKGENKIYGGEDARGLIGLPTDGVTHAKVEPGNHSSFDIFVQSRSVNRKIVRGTRVLVDKTLTKSQNPTWGTV